MSTAATDVGMHGLLAMSICYHSVLPPSLCTCGPVVDFFITKPSLHPFDFVRNLFHLLVNLCHVHQVRSSKRDCADCPYILESSVKMLTLYNTYFTVTFATKFY